MTILSVFLGGTLQVQASQETHSGAFFVPWTFLERTLNVNGENGVQLDIELPPIHLSEVNFSLPRVGVNLKYQLRLEEVNGNTTIWQTDNLSANIEVPSFSISQEIVKMIGGVRVVIPIRASCERFQIKMMKVAIHTKSSWSVNGIGLKSSMDHFDFGVEPGSWEIAPISCQGPSGLGELMSEGIHSALTNPGQIRGVLQKSIQHILNSRIESLLNEISKNPWEYKGNGQQLKIALIGMELMQGRGFVFHGQISTSGLNDEKESFVPVSNEVISISHHELEDALEESDSRPIMIVSNSSAISIISKTLKESLYSGDMTEVPAFKSLMRSRFLQLFLWPDLWEYPKRAKFPVVAKFDDGLVLSEKSNSSFDLSGDLHTWIRSKRQNLDWNYIYLKTRLRSNISFQIRDGEIQFLSTARKLDSKMVFYPNYVEKFSPSEYVATSILDKAIESLGTLDKVNLELPLLRLGQLVTLKASRVNKSKSRYFLLEWDLNN